MKESSTLYTITANADYYKNCSDECRLFDYCTRKNTTSSTTNS